MTKNGNQPINITILLILMAFINIIGVLIESQLVITAAFFGLIAMGLGYPLCMFLGGLANDV